MRESPLERQVPEPVTLKELMDCYVPGAHLVSGYPSTQWLKDNPLNAVEALGNGLWVIIPLEGLKCYD